ncbi:tape measure protein [Serratia sp. IR-2025]|uniref:Tape measure domain-containing protein n=2 Tax=Serratia TaxID=613 RepID=A0ABD5BDM9_SERMA|nr:tape measure domain-containing protein [Serratia marcescens]MDE5238449.1 tape measure domain-containing protein [Serratia marcescens]MDE5256588.1 tape measure domain-containing protein [Serratia marcescens]MDQ9380363.1 tape measure domain-containing protein [Serratia marcescens]MDQ9401773.1 tape measure domain-containing protein [Serratia marcescens]MDQ9426047.1 tape measure domain-containing protein [Serratia marcescens]
MSSNMIITSTKNVVSWEVDRGSFAKAKKAIKSIGQEWDKTASKMKAATSKVTPPGAERFKQSEYTRRTKAARAEAAAAKQAAREQLQAERKIQQIHAKSIRFSTAASSYNLTGKQRTESLSQFGDLTRQFHAGKIAVGEYNAAVSKLQTNMRKQGRVGMKGQTLPVTAKVTKLDTSMIEGAKGAITIAATVAVGKSIMTAGQDLQSMESGLTAVTGSADKAAKEMQYLRDQSNRLGLDLIKVGKDYTSFYAAAKSSMSDGQVRNLFEGVSEYGTVLGASADEQSRALKALNQMASKGQIMSEELKGQLSESLPGAVDVFVKALQKTQNNVNLTTKDLFKMMEEGKLMSKDILPAVADEFKALARNGGALDRAVNSNRASFQRLKTAMQASMGEFFDGGFGSALTNAFDTISAALNNNADSFKFWGDLAGNVIDGATDAFAYLYDTIVFVASVGGHYLEQMGISFEGLKGWGEMAAYALGVTAFAGSMWKLGGALKWIIGFLHPLTKLLGVLKSISALGGVEAATAGGVAKTASKTTGGVAGAASKVGMVGKAGKLLGPLGTLYSAWEVGQSQFGDPTERINQARLDSKPTNPWLEAAGRAAGMYQLADSIAPPPALRPQPTIDLSSIYSGSAFMNTYRNPVEAATQKHQIEVTSVVKVQDGAVKGLVREEIEDFDGRQINMMIGGGH